MLARVGAQRTGRANYPTVCLVLVKRALGFFAAASCGAPCSRAPARRALRRHRRRRGPAAERAAPVPPVPPVAPVPPPPVVVIVVVVPLATRVHPPPRQRRDAAPHAVIDFGRVAAGRELRKHPVPEAVRHARERCVLLPLFRVGLGLLLIVLFLWGACDCVSGGGLRAVRRPERCRRCQMCSPPRSLGRTRPASHSPFSVWQLTRWIRASVSSSKALLLSSPLVYATRQVAALHASCNWKYQVPNTPATGTACRRRCGCAAGARSTR